MNVEAQVYLQIAQPYKETGSQKVLKALEKEYREEWSGPDARLMSEIHVKACETARQIDEVDQILKMTQKKYWSNCYGLGGEINRTCRRITGAVCCIITINLIGGVVLLAPKVFSSSFIS